MLRSYLRIAVRNLRRHKGYSAINILGLTVGLACFLLIALYVQDEVSYDRFHTNADRIYRVTRDFVSPDGTVSLHLGHAAPPFGPLLKNDFDEIEQIARLLESNSLFTYQENVYNEENVFIAEPAIFKIFSIKTLQGNPEKALNDPFTVMFSAPMAKKYFGNDDPIGKTIRLDNQYTATVTGVFEPLPAQSHFHPNFLISFATLEDSRIYGKEQLKTNWSNNSFATYLLLPARYNVAKMEKAFPAFLDKHMGKDTHTWTNLYLQKLTDIHLRSQLDSEIEANGDIRYVYIFSAIALFILLIACINYMNLATARSAGRAKEVGLRKVVGAFRSQLIGQFLSESLVLTSIALVLACLVAILLLHPLNTFTGKALSFSSFTQGPTIGVLLVLAILTGVLAGSYPAFFLSAFEPVKVLKGKLSTASRNDSLRRVLVVIQFSISIILIVSTTVVFRQLNYMQQEKLGYKKDQMLILPVYEDSTVNYQTLKEELKSHGSVKNTGRSSREPSGRLLDSMGAEVMKGDSLAPTTATIKYLSVDHDFLSTYEMKLAAGRDFSRAVTTDDTAAYILNETAVRLIGWKSPNQAIDQVFSYNGRTGKVIGVVRDFYFESLHEEIAPLVLLIQPDNFTKLSISLEGKDVQASVAHIEKVWKKFMPNRPFKYKFLDENFSQLYKAEEARGQLFTIMASLSIFIACLGLFGLASFTVSQRIKEIGVRKVMGASVPSIVVLLSKEFTKLVMLAFLIAIPFSWYFMHTWLQDFAYRINIGAGIFVIAGAVALCSALVTVSYQSVKAALTNPVKALRSE
jgi:putative ABC transport system permease protein